jgi:nucleotide-binding universal stress UspA family protein
LARHLSGLTHTSPNDFPKSAPLFLVTQIKAGRAVPAKMGETTRKHIMYKNILVPVSFEADRNAQGAMKIAQSLRAEGGAITCLHVLEQLPKYATEYLPAGHLETAKEDVVNDLQSLVEGVENASTVVVDGHSSRTILNHADNNDVDLIIIASHQPGMQDYLLGSTAAKVVRHAKCAVHVLR